MPAIQQHNAQTSREVEVVKETDRILRLNLFPYERVWVDVRFDLSMTEHSSSKMNSMQINGEVHGVVEIRFQSLFLWHDFSSFINEVIPHELAHVLLTLRYAEQGVEAGKPHDEDWMDIVSDINPDMEPAAKVKGDFDDRPIKIHKGGISCACECGGVEAIAVFANTPSSVIKLKNEEICCNECSSSYCRVQESDWPEEFVKKVNFYRGLMERKAHLQPLSR